MKGIFKKGLSKNTDAINELEELVHKTSKNISRISEDIKNLTEGLKTEVEARKNISKEVDSKLDKLKGALWLASAFGGSIVLLAIGFLTGLISF